jgi:hypothetical protein
LREIEKENPSRRISAGLEATSSEQQQGISGRTELRKLVFSLTINYQLQ